MKLEPSFIYFDYEDDELRISKATPIDKTHAPCFLISDVRAWARGKADEVLERRLWFEQHRKETVGVGAFIQQLDEWYKEFLEIAGEGEKK